MRPAGRVAELGSFGCEITQPSELRDLFWHSQNRGRGNMESVSFLHVEDGDDLIVSFAICAGDPGDVKSLSLIRTPKYEIVFSAEERGVNVSHDDFPENEDDQLRRISISADEARIETRYQRFELDLTRVDSSELQQAYDVLRQMNFDNAFILQIG